MIVFNISLPSTTWLGSSLQFSTWNSACIFISSVHATCPTQFTAIYLIILLISLESTLYSLDTDSFVKQLKKSLLKTKNGEAFHVQFVTSYCLFLSLNANVFLDALVSVRVRSFGMRDRIVRSYKTEGYIVNFKLHLYHCFHCWTESAHEIIDIWSSASQNTYRCVGIFKLQGPIDVAFIALEKQTKLK
jgi:hypothetical protein